MEGEKLRGHQLKNHVYSFFPRHEQVSTAESRYIQMSPKPIVQSNIRFTCELTIIEFLLHANHSLIYKNVMI